MIRVRDLEWTAGFLEGEGSFVYDKKTAVVCAEQVQKQPLERLRSLFGGSLTFSERGGRNGIWRWRVSGVTAAGLSMTLYSLMSPRRQAQIVASLAVWRRAMPGSKYRKGLTYQKTAA